MLRYFCVDSIGLYSFFIRFSTSLKLMVRRFISMTTPQIKAPSGKSIRFSPATLMPVLRSRRLPKGSISSFATIPICFSGFRLTTTMSSWRGGIFGSTISISPLLIDSSVFSSAHMLLSNIRKAKARSECGMVVATLSLCFISTWLRWLTYFTAWSISSSGIVFFGSLPAAA